MVLRHEGIEYKFNDFYDIIFNNRGNFFCNENSCIWNFHSQKNNIILNGTIEAKIKNIVKLNYYNPPSGK
jgi:hypothetical protein